MAEDTVLSQNSLKTMQLNDQKAGMEGLDKEAINKIIYEASKGTPYFVHQEKRQQRIDRRAKEMLGELERVSDLQRREAMEKMDELAMALEAERDLSRSIVHIDMDAFYAAVEMLDNPELKTKPMAVGSMQMLSTSNYEARKYGVRAAMAGFIAKKLCPELTIVPCRFDRYREISKKIRNVVKHYDPDYSPMGLDEVYLDLTEYIKKVYSERHHLQCCCEERNHESATCPDVQDGDIIDGESLDSGCCKCSQASVITDEERDRLAYEIVEEIRRKIQEATQLTASAGIAPNTRLAKVCSDQNKPNGQYQIRSDVNEVKKFIENLPVKKVSGIGPVQGQLLNRLGIETCSDMWRKRDVVDLLFSQRSARFYMKVALGIGSTTVKSDRVRKSIGNEETFREISRPEELHQKCEELCDEAVEDMKTRDLLGKVVILKIKTSHFEVHTRNFTFPTHTCDREVIIKAAKKLLDNEIDAASPESLKLRLMGIRMANLVHSSEVVDAKQIKIKDFLQSKSCCSNKPPQTSQYSCPVCHTELTCSLTAFNMHVDQCLTADRAKNEKLEAFCAEEQSLQHISVSSSKPNSQVMAQTAAADHSSDQNSEQRFVCPVCGIEQRSCELSDLNSHIDSCLNRAAIKEILSSDVSLNKTVEQRKVNQDKRKSSPKKHQSLKRPKVNSPKLKTIDSYFH